VDRELDDAVAATRADAILRRPFLRAKVAAAVADAWASSKSSSVANMALPPLAVPASVVSVEVLADSPLAPTTATTTTTKAKAKKSEMQPLPNDFCVLLVDDLDMMRQVRR